MNFEERKKEVQRRQRLVEKNRQEIYNHPFVTKKKKLIDKHNEVITALLKECTHDEVEIKTNYYSGSYYDHAHTDNWTVCKLCGERSEIKQEMHSWYG